MLSISGIFAYFIMQPEEQQFTFSPFENLELLTKMFYFNLFLAQTKITGALVQFLVN